MKSSKRNIIINYLMEEIASGRLKEGDQIPSEKNLVEKFNFSRQTIHNALSDLALQGIITRTAGRGSFVSTRPVNRNIQKKMSFTEDMSSIGLVAGSQLLEFKIIRGKNIPDIAKKLNVSDEDSLYYLCRLRTGNDTPIAIQESYMPTKYFPDLDLNAINKSLESYVEEKGLKITGFITKLKAIEGSDEQMKLLHTANRALLNSVSIRYLDHSTPIHYTSSYYRSDLYEYTFSSFDD